MGFRQPRVPEYREGESLAAYMRQMILFLKDCTMAAWAANGRRIKEIRALETRGKALEEEMGGGIE
jgi:hypothetical protein